MRAETIAAPTRTDLRPSLRRSAGDRGPGHHRAGNAGGRARSRRVGDPDRRRRADRRQCRSLLARASRPIEIVGAEAALYPSFWNALHGAHRPLGGATLAEGIAVKNVGVLTLPIVRELVSDIVLVDEAHLERAVNAYLTLQKTMAEGAGAAGLAAMLAEPERFRGRKVGLILCGGNIDARILASVMVRELEREHRIVSFRLTIPDRPGVLGQIATRLGRTRRQYSGGRAPPALPRRPGQGRQARRHGRRRAIARMRKRILRGARRRRLSADADRDRDHDGMRRPGDCPLTLCLDMISAGAANRRAEGYQALREKELRIALVCFGGVSLAVYMHGVTKEILKLVRASSALHAIADRARRAKAVVLRWRRSQRPGIRHRERLFRAAARHRRAASSCAWSSISSPARRPAASTAPCWRARSATTCRWAALRDLWLDNADVAVLLSPDARAGAWSKWFLKPLAVGVRPHRHACARSRDMEVRQKLSLFVRSRWFKPPLDGRVMAGLMYDAVTSMGRRDCAALRCCRPATSLDLFVTLTDYYGYQQLVQIHDPPLIHELRSSPRAAFHLRRHPNGEVESDFGLDNAPALAFAARATSSFPGAFPPARIVEMDEVVAQRHGSWPRRAEFIAKAFRQPSARRRRPGNGIVSSTARCSTTALSRKRSRQSTAGRPIAQVDRRLVYIDPHPAAGATAAPAGKSRLLRDAARRDVGHSKLAAGHRRAYLGARFQRAGSPAARDHRQRSPANRASWCPRS